MRRLTIYCLAFVFGLSLATDLEGQTPIVLRDLTLIRDVSIASFDQSGIILTNGRKLNWDEVLKAEVAADRQPVLDQFIREFGLPTMRLKSRIRNGDWIGAGRIAEPVFASRAPQSNPVVDIDDHYLVCLATMRARLHRGDRANALWPFIQSAILQPDISEPTSQLIGENRLDAPIVRRFLSDEILPVWFDKSGLAETSQRLSELLETQTDPRPGIMVYLTSLQIELGQVAEANETLRQLTSVNDPQIAAWLIVLESRLKQTQGNQIGAQATLLSRADEIIGTARIAAWYYQGLCIDLENTRDTSEAMDIDRAKAMMALLRIPALHGDSHPDLAAAALFHASRISRLRGRLGDEQKLQNELLKKYAHTYHGALEKESRTGQ